MIVEFETNLVVIATELITITFSVETIITV